MKKSIPAFVGSILLLSACAGRPVPAPAETTAAAPPTAAHDTGPQIQVVNRPGEMVALDDVLVPGKVTVVDFYADWCGPCKVLDKQLAVEIADEPRIAVRKIDIAQDTSAVARRYQIGALPHVRIYDGDGRLLHTLVGADTDRTGMLAHAAVERL